MYIESYAFKSFTSDISDLDSELSSGICVELISHGTWTARMWSTN